MGIKASRKYGSQGKLPPAAGWEVGMRGRRVYNTLSPLLPAFPAPLQSLAPNSCRDGGTDPAAKPQPVDRGTLPCRQGLQCLKGIFVRARSWAIEIRFQIPPSAVGSRSSPIPRVPSWLVLAQPLCGTPIPS